LAGSERSRKTHGDRKNCPVCLQRGLGGGEIYVLAGESGISIFDVEKATELASDGRPARPVPRDILERILQFSHFEPAHVRHVNSERPGILGQRSAGPFLIDGTHRAVRMMQRQMPFTSYCLTPEETHLCLLSQDIGETDIGVAVQELRKLLSEHADTHNIEIELNCGDEAIRQIRKLLTPAENRRIAIRAAQSSTKQP
jgi:hypothetical protein